jgi:hypothetical protein
MNRTMVGLLITVIFCALSSADISVAIIVDESASDVAKQADMSVADRLADIKGVTLVDRSSLKKPLRESKIQSKVVPTEKSIRDWSEEGLIGI